MTTKGKRMNAIRRPILTNFAFVSTEWKNSEDIARDIAHVIAYAMAMMETKGQTACLDIVSSTSRSDINSYLHDPWNMFLQKVERAEGGG